jgi:hypothetical protein
MTDTYVKKLTAANGWQRRLDAVDPETGEVISMPPQPFMRIAGRALDGWMETSETSDYIRWIGTFRAIAVNKDGTVSTFISRNLIFPAVSDYLQRYFHQTTKETTVKGRTSDYFILADANDADKKPLDFVGLNFVSDVYLKQPLGKTRLGYEYEISFPLSPIVTSDMAWFDGLPDLRAFYTPPATDPAPPATDPAPPTVDPANDPAVEQSEPAKRRRHG